MLYNYLEKHFVTSSSRYDNKAIQNRANLTFIAIATGSKFFDYRSMFGM